MTHLNGLQHWFVQVVQHLLRPVLARRRHVHIAHHMLHHRATHIVHDRVFQTPLHSKGRWLQSNKSTVRITTKQQIQCHCTKSTPLVRTGSILSSPGQQALGSFSLSSSSSSHRIPRSEQISRTNHHAACWKQTASSRQSRAQRFVPRATAPVDPGRMSWQTVAGSPAFQKCAVAARAIA